MAIKGSLGASVQEICDLFSDYLDGDASRPAFIMSAHPLGTDARHALEKSMEAFGYQLDSCTFATLHPGDAATRGSEEDAESEDSREDVDGVPLDAQAAFLLVEALDPLYVICTDSESATTLASAYRATLELDKPIRLFGRDGVAFSDLAALIESQPGKRKAWELLKSLNRK